MLVLTRKVNECILIDSTVEIRVLRTHKNKVTIGLSAPREMPICRGELQRQINSNIEEFSHVSTN
jgi:carbon storage regulator CsrA